MLPTASQAKKPDRGRLHSQRYEAAAAHERGQLRHLLGLINESFGTSLTDKGVESWPGVKKELSAPLEAREGVWTEEIKKVRSGRDRMTIAGSLFLHRKVLSTPPGEDPLRNYVEKLGASKRVNPKFLRFVRREVPRILGKGWDKSYRRHVRSMVVNESSTTSNSRKRGGGRKEWEGDRIEVLREMALGEREVEIPKLRKVVAIEDGGKKRIVTVGPPEMAVLQPLHRALDDQLKGKEWRLVGDAKAHRFTSDWGVKKGEVFVSGDYESATDNFVLEVSHCVLSSVLDLATRVPISVKRVALDSLAGVLYGTYSNGEKFEVLQKSGQLMGNYLSFPLLCLVNYLAFKFFIPRSGVPVYINGDDIVFRCSREEYEQWSEGVSQSGLILSKGKTLVSSSFFSINSAFFTAGEKKVRLLPVIRSTCFYRPLDNPASLAGRFLMAIPNSAPPRLRNIVRSSLLSFYRPAISELPGSLWTTLGIAPSIETLRMSGLLRREVFFFRRPQFSHELETAPSVMSFSALGFRRLLSTSTNDALAQASLPDLTRHFVSVASHPYLGPLPKPPPRRYPLYRSGRHLLSFVLGFPSVVRSYRELGFLSWKRLLTTESIPESMRYRKSRRYVTVLESLLEGRKIAFVRGGQ